MIEPFLFTINNIDSKFSEKITNPKYYFYDTGLLNLFLINQTPALLENLVAIFLIQNCYNESIYFFNNNSYEIDFYIPEKNLAIQVCCSLSNEETKTRETKALIEFSKFSNCNKLFIITLDEEAEIEKDDKIIKVIPMWKILLNYSHLLQ